MEIWKLINGFENYEVSNLGNVRSFKFGKEKILKPVKCNNEYLRVGLFYKGVQSKFFIHQLVAIAFLNHIRCGFEMVVNHKDFNRQNNYVDNLEIISTRNNTNKKHLKYTSKYIGVGWHKVGKKWSSRIVIDRKRIHLGLFENEYDAHLAYQNALIQVLK